MDAKVKQGLEDFARNERWGRCVDCPHNKEGDWAPEWCVYTNRADHNLTLTDLIDLYERTTYGACR